MSAARSECAVLIRVCRTFFQGIGVYFLITENYREIQEFNHTRTFYPLFMIFPYVREGRPSVCCGSFFFKELRCILMLKKETPMP
jgi:hypothetical protein